MTETLSIQFTETDTKGRYSATKAGVADEAELTISKVSPSLIIADHTFVPNDMRGSGAGKALVQKLISDAREKGQRIVPLCPFVRAFAEKHREAYADVFQF